MTEIDAAHIAGPAPEGAASAEALLATFCDDAAQSSVESALATARRRIALAGGAPLAAPLIAMTRSAADLVDALAQAGRPRGSALQALYRVLLGVEAQRHGEDGQAEAYIEAACDLLAGEAVVAPAAGEGAGPPVAAAASGGFVERFAKGRASHG